MFPCRSTISGFHHCQQCDQIMRISQIIIAALLSSIFCSACQVVAQDILKVGVYENKPLIFTGSDGEPAGLFIDLFAHIAQEEDWELEYIAAPWDITLDSLKNGKIDILPVVAYSDKRNEFLNFTDETIMANWAEMYTTRTTSLNSLLELEGRKVAVKMGDIHFAALKDLTERFNINCRFIETDSYTTIFEMLDSNYLDVGVVNRMFGKANKSNYGVKITPVIYNPIELRYASPKGKHIDTLTVIDTYLAKFKNDTESIFYKGLQRWLMVEPENRIPAYIKYLIASILAAVLLLVSLSLLLRHQVRRQTRTLTKTNLHLKQEIRKRREAMEDLKRYARVVEASDDAIALLDPRQNHLLFNNAYLKIFNRSRGEVEKLSLSSVVGSDFYEQYLERAAKRCLGNEQVNLDGVYHPTSGPKRHLHIQMGPYIPPGGPIAGLVINIRDITQEIELKVQLIRAQKMETIGQLAGGVAHDLNNILSGIVSYPDMLLVDRPESDPMHKPLTTIKKSGKKAADIVSDLLTLARRGVENVQTTNLNIIIREFLSSPECRALLGPYQNVTIKTDLDSELLNISGSPIHLSKCLMNLFTNGLEAMESGGTLTISTENSYFEESVPEIPGIGEGEYAVLVITDTGVGMTEEMAKHIFEPFYTSKIMGRSGTGLGMTLVWNSVRDHNGYITVDSAPGDGTTFKIFYPVTRAEITVHKTEGVEEYRGAGEKVLVVDDVEEQRTFATEILTKLGYKVESAGGGDEAVSMVREKEYDILVLDMIMPGGLDGLATYEQVLSHRPAQKAIIASGYSASDNIVRVQTLGAGAYVKKPYTVLSLARALKTELHTGRISN